MINFDKNFSFLQFFGNCFVILCFVQNKRMGFVQKYNKKHTKISTRVTNCPAVNKENRMNRKHFKKDFTQAQLHVKMF